jgi:hypothetical protein
MPPLLPIVQNNQTFLQILEVSEAFGPKERLGTSQLGFEGAVQREQNPEAFFDREKAKQTNLFVFDLFPSLSQPPEIFRFTALSHTSYDTSQRELEQAGCRTAERRQRCANRRPRIAGRGTPAADRRIDG